MERETPRRRLTTYFLPLVTVMRGLAGRFSARTAVLVLAGGPTVGLLLYPLDLPSATLTLAVAFALIVIASAAFDLSHGTSRRPWFLLATTAWLMVVLSLNVVAHPKQYYDEALLTESALSDVVAGENPYVASYRGTLLDEFVDRRANRPHPAEEHYVYFPGNLLTGLPAYALAKRFGLPFDQRFVYLVGFGTWIVLMATALRRSPVREPLTLLTFLNPFTVYVMWGFNDAVLLLLLTATGVALARGRPRMAAVAFGLALATKQSALVLLPFLLPLLVRAARTRSLPAWQVVGLTGVVAGAILAPFALPSPAAFFDDTVRFFSSSTAYSMDGWGIGGLLVRSGAAEPFGVYPFWMIEAVLALPVVGWLWWRTRRAPAGQVMAAAAMAIGAVWFCSRYFLPAHATFVILLLGASAVVGEVARTSTYASPRLNHPPDVQRS